jgi:hypothetical protein
MTAMPTARHGFGVRDAEAEVQVKQVHPALEKIREDQTGEWFLLLELDDDPQAVERTTEEIGPVEACELLIGAGLSEREAQTILTAAHRAFAPA